MTSRHILLLEDEPAIADTLLYALRSEGFEVCHVLLAREALARFAQRPPDLPQSVVRAVPVPGEVVDERDLQRPGVLGVVQPVAAGHLQGVHHLAQHVELALPGGGVPDEDGGGPGVPG